MTRWFAIIGFVLFLAGALLSGCDNATPPIAGPNLSPIEGPSDESSPGLTSDKDHIVIPPNFAQNPCSNCDTTPGNLLPTPDATIKSAALAFKANQAVIIQVTGPDEATNLPLVGPVSPESSNQLNTRIEMIPNNDGTIQFGVYVNSTTTPGTYTFSASQGTKELTLSLDVIAQEDVN